METRPSVLLPLSLSLYVCRLLSVCLSATCYQQLNRLSDFRETRYRSSLQKVVRKAWVLSQSVSQSVLWQSCFVLTASHSDCTVLTVTVSLGRDPHGLATGVTVRLWDWLLQCCTGAQGLVGHSVMVRNNEQERAWPEVVVAQFIAIFQRRITEIFSQGTLCADPGLYVSWTAFGTLTSRKIDEALYLLEIEQ